MLQTLFFETDYTNKIESAKIRIEISNKIDFFNKNNSIMKHLCSVKKSSSEN